MRDNFRDIEAIRDGSTWLEALPERLIERVCRGSGLPLRREGEFVLHWMTGGARGHEQPALDLAIEVANAHGLPVLSVQGLGAEVPFASDRHWAFVLQAAPGIQAECHERGVRYEFFLARDGRAETPLGALLRRSALTVVDEVPVPPIVDWANRLCGLGQRDGVRVPVVSVDTSCVVPMSLGPLEPSRAFKFRDKTAKLRKARLQQEWPEPRAEARAEAIQLPFERLPVEELTANPDRLETWIRSCPIDHTVAPVSDTRGSAQAGYERWEFFKKRMRHYAGTRNDPTKHGVSRMSGYLHHGQVSPFRLAREASALGGKGAEKYLDELLIWRELAWHWSYREPQVHSANAIPAWARESLERHRADERSRSLTFEAAERGRSGDELWDLCQTSLLRHGELHNNLRMTWGKALVEWSPRPEDAVRRLVDLNHRFALDGRDPSSYGGLYWCVGLFDRPFEPEHPVLGSIRARPTDEHRKRLRIDAYRSQVQRSIGGGDPKIAVVGAGLSGAICARVLVDHGLEVTVFDKGRGPGGRMSTRRMEGDDPASWSFDHGAQYFTARDPRFRRSVAQWIEARQVAPWRGRIVALEAGIEGPDPNPGPRYVGTPSMNAVVRHLHEDLSVRFETEVRGVSRDGERFGLVDSEGRDLGEFDLVLCAIPIPQASALLGELEPSFAERFEEHQVLPSICTMLALDGELDLGFDAAFVTDEVLSWVARNNSKPGRSSGGGDCFVLHSTGDWAKQVLELEPHHWISAMTEAFTRVVGRDLPASRHAAGHRWRYALPIRTDRSPSAFDRKLGLGLAGDGCTGGRVEGAFLSGQDLAGRVLRSLTLSAD
ncbi:MAG: FAD-dependent oxidoreductase [Planctomycetota bacterium]